MRILNREPLVRISASTASYLTLEGRTNAKARRDHPISDDMRCEMAPNGWAQLGPLLSRSLQNVPATCLVPTPGLHNDLATLCSATSIQSEDGYARLCPRLRRRSSQPVRYTAETHDGAQTFFAGAIVFFTSTTAQWTGIVESHVESPKVKRVIWSPPGGCASPAAVAQD